MPGRRKITPVPIHEKIITQEKGTVSFIRFLEDIRRELSLKMVWHGNWEAGSYDSNSVVNHNNCLWIANKPTKETPSLVSQDWDNMLCGGT